MAPQGTLTYAGIHSEGRFSLTRSAGVSAGIISAQFLESSRLPPTGPVVIAFGNSTITLANCRLRRDLVSTAGGGGRYQDVLLEDRRWMWQFDGPAGPLYGYYNHWEKGIKVKDNRFIKSIRDLATMLLQYMGEQSFDASILPSDFYPPVEWDGVNPAAALEALVDQVGCQVVFTWNDTVRIVQRGQGIPAPTPQTDSRVMEYTLSYEPQVLPGRVIIESGITRFQADLPLEPVGLEPDTKKYEPIDSLSYKPAGGWEKEAPGYFYGVTDAKLRDLAQSCIYRMFRVKPPFTLSLGKVKFQNSTAATVVADELWRVLPLEATQLEIYRSPTAENLKDAQIIGYFCDMRSGYKNNATVPTGFTPGPDAFKNDNIDTQKRELIYQGFSQSAGEPGTMAFSIDTERGIVRTNDYLYLAKLDGNGNYAGIEPPKIVLRTSFVLRDKDTRAPLRQQYIIQTGQSVPLTKTLRIPELLYEVGYPSVVNQDPVGPSDFEAQCQYYAKQYMAALYDGPAATIPMKGFALDISLDGAVRSVSFRRSDSGQCTTEIEWQCERPETKLTYQELFNTKTVNQEVASFRRQKAAWRRQRGAGIRSGSGGFGV